MFPRHKAWSCYFHICLYGYSYHLFTKAWHSSPRLFLFYKRLMDCKTNQIAMRMKKIFLAFAMILVGISMANAAEEQQVESYTLLAAASSNRVEGTAVESIQASNGDETRNYTIFKVKENNGKWFFYIPYKGVNYGVRWSNEYRKFYIYVDYSKWYFWSKTLDYYSGQNNNGY